MKKKLIQTILSSTVLLSATPFCVFSSCSISNDIKSIDGTDWEGLTFGEFAPEDMIINHEDQSVTYICGTWIHAFDLVIPNYVHYKNKIYKVLIGEGCFANCSGLSGSVELNQFMLEIPNNCFMNCFNLTGVYCNAYPITVGDFAFYGCVLLVRIRIIHDTFISNDWAMKTVYIGNYAFANTWLEGELKFGSNLLHIGLFAFSYCHKVTSVNLQYSNSLYYIDDGTFRGSDNIRYVKLPSSIQWIGNEAFTYCSWLQTIYLPTKNQQLKLGNRVFQQCRNFSGFVPQCKITEIGEGCFAFDEGLSDYLWLNNNGLDYIPPHAFASTKFNTLVFEPEHPKNVDNEAFIDSSTTTLDFSAFGPDDEVPNWIGRDIFQGISSTGTIYLSRAGTLSEQWRTFFLNNDIDLSNWKISQAEGQMENITPPENDKDRTITVEFQDGKGEGTFNGFSYQSKGFIVESEFRVSFNTNIEGHFTAQISSFDRINKTFNVTLTMSDITTPTNFDGTLTIFYKDNAILVNHGPYHVLPEL